MNFKRRLLNALSEYNCEDTVGYIVRDIIDKIDKIDLNRVLVYDNLYRVIFTRIGDTANMHITYGEDPDYAEDVFTLGF